MNNQQRLLALAFDEVADWHKVESLPRHFRRIIMDGNRNGKDRFLLMKFLVANGMEPTKAAVWVEAAGARLRPDGMWEIISQQVRTDISSAKKRDRKNHVAQLVRQAQSRPDSDEGRAFWQGKWWSLHTKQLMNKEHLFQ